MNGTDETSRIWTTQGNAQLDTAQSKFGSASALLDGNGDYASAASSPALDIAGDFTIEAWARFNSTSASAGIAGKFGNPSNAGWYLYWSKSGQALIFVDFISGASNITVSSSTWVPATGTWYHLAVTRTGNVFRIFVDGSQVGTYTTANAVTNSSSTLQIGATGGGRNFNGWIDEFRFSNGIARWTSNFTPPTSEYSLIPPTATPSPTGTPTATQTSTPTLTATPTSTNAPTATPSPTATATFTPTPIPPGVLAALSYDANGNMNCRVENGITYQQVYDAENRLSAVSVMSGGCTGMVTSTTSFMYDGDGNLVKKVNQDGSRTLYVAGIYEVDKSSDDTVAHTRTYYPAAGAMRVDSTLYFMLQDHLGSTSMMTDASGNIAGKQRYYPFGETRYTSGTMYTDKLFTGQRQMTDLGIYYYNARFYSPYINRFLSADTIVPGYANPQSLNRFSYVLNNPLRYTDPTGHRPIEEQGGTQGCSNPKYCQDGKPKTDKKTDNKCVDLKGNHVGCIGYISGSLGLDAPALMILAGVGVSLAGAPVIGLPVALAGATFEACAYTATPQCAAVKLLSLNVSATIDRYGNLYLGPQISWGKSILPGVAVSDYFGLVMSGTDHTPTESEVRDTLSGFSVSAGSIATGGVSYSPLASTYKTTYYLDGFPEVFSVNANYNFRIYDFSP